MSAAIKLRDDYDGAALRALAKASSDANQTRRLLALAAIYDGGSRTEAARCPELNPVENIWQYLRGNWLSNRVSKSHNDKLNHCCNAWNKLMARPWKITSIGTREWAYGS